jgi:hypothetical protein
VRHAPPPLQPLLLSFPRLRRRATAVFLSPFLSKAPCPFSCRLAKAARCTHALPWSGGDSITHVTVHSHIQGVPQLYIEHKLRLLTIHCSCGRTCCPRLRGDRLLPKDTRGIFVWLWHQLVAVSGSPAGSGGQPGDPPGHRCSTSAGFQLCGSCLCG